MTNKLTGGTARDGPMTGMISRHANTADLRRASENFARVMAHVANLYCAGESSSIPAFEAHELALSTAYALGIAHATPEEAACVLNVENPVALWREGICELEKRTDAALLLWHEAVTTMPPIRNVALRDTLASLGEIKRRYDVYFAAHVVPCDIDYQLSLPIDTGLLGIGYVEAWLSRFLSEARWISRFDVDSCTAMLERICPDYRGLHVNLYDLLLPHESELTPVGSSNRRMHASGQSPSAHLGNAKT